MGVSTMRKKGDDSASGLGAEWYKKACAITSTQMFGGRCETETVNRTQQKNKMGKVEIFYKCHTQEEGWYLALDVGNGTMKNVCPYQNKFGEKCEWYILTTVEYNIEYIFLFVYIFVYILTY